MKTFNVFTSNESAVLMGIYGSVNKDGEIKRDTSAPIIETRFDITEEMLEPLATNKDGEYMSLAAYGLSRLMQDRCSSFTDGGASGYKASGFTEEEAALDRMKEYQKVYDLVKSGRFNVERESAGKKKTLSPSILRAFVNFCATKDKHITELQATSILSLLEAAKLEPIKQMLKDAGFIKIALEELKAERIEAENDLADLDLGSLLG